MHSSNRRRLLPVRRHPGQGHQRSGLDEAVLGVTRRRQRLGHRGAVGLQGAVVVARVREGQRILGGHAQRGRGSVVVPGVPIQIHAGLRPPPRLPGTRERIRDVVQGIHDLAPHHRGRPRRQGVQQLQQPRTGIPEVAAALIDQQVEQLELRDRFDQRIADGHRDGVGELELISRRIDVTFVVEPRCEVEPRLDLVSTETGGAQLVRGALQRALGIEPEVELQRAEGQPQPTVSRMAGQGLLEMLDHRLAVVRQRELAVAAVLLAGRIFDIDRDGVAAIQRRSELVGRCDPHRQQAQQHEPDASHRSPTPNAAELVRRPSASTATTRHNSRAPSGRSSRASGGTVWRASVRSNAWWTGSRASVVTNTS